MKKLLLLVVLSAMLCSSGTPRGTRPVTPIPQQQDATESTIAVDVFPADAGTYGFDVYVDGVRIIHQPMVPGLPGTLGFTKYENARKVGELMADKLRRSIFPPAITVAELDSLDVL